MSSKSSFKSFVAESSVSPPQLFLHALASCIVKYVEFPHSLTAPQFVRLFFSIFLRAGLFLVFCRSNLSSLLSFLLFRFFTSAAGNAQISHNMQKIKTADRILPAGERKKNRKLVNVAFLRFILRLITKILCR